MQRIDLPLVWFSIASTSDSVFGLKYASDTICTLRPKFNFFILVVSGKCSDTPFSKLQARTSDCPCARFEKNLGFCAQWHGQSRFLSEEQRMKRTQRQTEDNLERHRPILISIAEALLSPALRGHIDASDLVQQTLMEAHGNIDELIKLEDAPLLAWLRSALKHNVLDAIRHLRTAKKNIGRISV